MNMNGCIVLCIYAVCLFCGFCGGLIGYRFEKQRETKKANKKIERKQTHG